MEIWTKNDEYLSHHLISEDDALKQALANSRTNNLPDWEVSPTQGQFLSLLVKMTKSKRVLELGTLGGYSTIWLARAIPDDGIVISLEYDSHYAKVAQQNIEYAGLQSKIKIITGAALDIMNTMIAEKIEPFDMIFIDADKPNNPNYLRLSLQLSKSGTVIYGDNVIRDGELCNDKNPDPKVIGSRQFVEDMGKSAQLESTALQTVGAKGYDGFTLSIVK
ncbi:MAG: O-methyltransferase [Defluviitaleaceae bacterium]|nr:O-methyltransferase [Defluviitaleaceae bacterium]